MKTIADSLNKAARQGLGCAIIFNGKEATIGRDKETWVLNRKQLKSLMPLVVPSISDLIRIALK